jgi:hypothetical protein
MDSNKKSLMIGEWYPTDEEKSICKKLLTVVFILWELFELRDKVRLLKNHPIHKFTFYLWEFSAAGMVRVGELELLIKDIGEVVNDFKNSRNSWVKERTTTALRVMNEIIDGDYSIDKSIYIDPRRD